MRSCGSTRESCCQPLPFLVVVSSSQKAQDVHTSWHEVAEATHHPLTRKQGSSARLVVSGPGQLFPYKTLIVQDASSCSFKRPSARWRLAWRMPGKNLTFLDFYNNFYDEAKLAKARRPAVVNSNPWPCWNLKNDKGQMTSLDIAHDTFVSLQIFLHFVQLYLPCSSHAEPGPKEIFSKSYSSEA